MSSEQRYARWAEQNRPHRPGAWWRCPACRATAIAAYAAPALWLAFVAGVITGGRL